MKKIKVFFIILFLLFIYSSICAVSYVNAISTSISNEIFRLHVIANSDSDDDQALKYIVRDNVLKYVNSMEFNSKAETIEFLSNNLEIIKQIAKDTIISEGFDYDIDVEIGNFNFPTKHYGDISFPAGYYDALRIKIGNSEGKNWWCVMFPPLCFVDVTSGVVSDDSKQVLEDNLSEEEYALVSDSSVPVQFKFRLFEFFNSFTTLLANI